MAGRGARLREYEKNYNKKQIFFRRYRLRAAEPVVTPTQINRRRNRVKRRLTPLKLGNIDSWTRNSLIRPVGRINLDNVNDVNNIPADETNAQKAWERLQEKKQSFASDHFSYVKCLGYGGMGLALHWNWSTNDPNTGNVIQEQVVLKVSLRGEYDYDIRQEARETLKLKRATHIIQLLNPPSFNTYPGYLDPEELDSDEQDSSDGENESNYDDTDDDDKIPPPKLRRQEMDENTRAKRLLKFATRQRGKQQEINTLQFERAGAERKGGLRSAAGSDNVDDYEDHILFEYMEHGDMQNMLYRVNEQGNAPIPNRVLWSFFLCLIRGCIGMAWYPRKYSPQRTNDPYRLTELLEEIPAAGSPQESQMRRMVHFDIDPRNIFIGHVDPSAAPGNEHRLVPRVKIADFGIANVVKPQKRDYYYVKRRLNGKLGYYCPEQFCQDWDNIPLNPDAGRICDEPVAGNYGPPMNVWHIGLTMFVLITRCEPPRPPQPSNVNIGGIDMITYGNPLDHNDFAATDPQLIQIVKRCMTHDPAHRPGLRELLQVASAKVGNNPDPADIFQESNAVVTGWVNQFINNAAIWV